MYDPRADVWAPIGGLDKDCGLFDMAFTRGKVIAIGTFTIDINFVLISMTIDHFTLFNCRKLR